MKITCVKNLDMNINLNMSIIFVDGFYQWLKPISDKKHELVKLFQHMFNEDAFYVLMENDEVISICACTATSPSVILKKREFTKNLGFFKGSVVYMVLKKEFQNKKYPFEISSSTARIEFVATSANHQGKGHAKELLKYILSNTPYDSYVLEVANTNKNAIKLYENLGFKEFKRVANKHSKKTRIDSFIYMMYNERK